MEKAKQRKPEPVGDASGMASILGNQCVLQRMAVNNTGIPDQLKAQAEQKSGLSMDDVRVHYHSAEPAGVGALAYTQGTDVFIGPGQEQHLSHELGHVVQQKLGHVEATKSVNGRPVNDDRELEREADLF